MQIKGTLEVDEDRGVIWFHSEDGITVLRICGLPVNLHEDVKRGVGDVAVLDYEGRVEIMTNEFTETYERIESSIEQEA